ncbi:MAG: diguanylate cyclase [Desulfamplus sp.]|nr:diguanylate cyclase [Desulfamplus sp.]
MKIKKLNASEQQAINRVIIRPFVRRITITSMIAIVIIWSIAVWFGSGLIADERMKKLIGYERLEANNSVDAININIGHRLAYINSIPLIMATDPSLISLLMRFGSEVKPSELIIEERSALWSADPEMSRLSFRFGKIVAEIGINSLFVMNAAGDCVAEGHPPEDKAFIGTNYADRNYFLSSRSGQNGFQFAVGRVTNAMGLFYSSPVFSNGTFIGAVAVRINIDRLLPLVMERDAFVTDENDVIILARDSTLLMRMLPNGKINGVSAVEKEKRYKQREFETLDMTKKSDYSSNDLVLFKNQPYPYVMATRSNSDDNINVYVLRDMNEAAKRIHKDRLWWFCLLLLIGFLIVVLVFGGMNFVITNRLHRQTLIELNESLVEQASALEESNTKLKAANLTLAAISKTDGLTGIANRHYFDEVLLNEWRRAARSRQPIALVMLDVDFFKKYNDHYGHQAGDECLKLVANALVSSVQRSGELAARYGGEEFAAILPGLEGDNAFEVAEKIRATVQAQDIPHEMGTKAGVVTVSIGVATLCPANEHDGRLDKRDGDGQDIVPDNLLKKADKALYKAKHDGRNQVVLANS